MEFVSSFFPLILKMPQALGHF